MLVLGPIRNVSGGTSKLVGEPFGKSLHQFGVIVSVFTMALSAWKLGWMGFPVFAGMQLLFVFPWGQYAKPWEGE